MVWNDKLKREIPANWEVKTLGDICEMYQPEILSARDLPERGDYFVYGSNGVIGKYDAYNHEESSIAVSCRGDCGNVYRTLPKSWITGNAMIVKPLGKYQFIEKQFLFYMLKTAGVKNIITGSVQGQITRTNLEKVKIILPPQKLVEKYAIPANTIYKSNLSIELQNQKLAELRDWLLPMLMNGQISVN
jgi:type I restriction enzyme S subunit